MNSSFVSVALVVALAAPFTLAGKPGKPGPAPGALKPRIVTEPTKHSRSGKPHEHPLIKSSDVSTIESDGSEVTNVALPNFPSGLFVAMSNGKVFHYYSWDDIAGNDLKRAPNGMMGAK